MTNAGGLKQVHAVAWLGENRRVVVDVSDTYFDLDVSVSARQAVSCSNTQAINVLALVVQLANGDDGACAKCDA